MKIHTHGDVIAAVAKAVADSQLDPQKRVVPEWSWRTQELTWSGPDRLDAVDAGIISSELFHVLGIRPAFRIAEYDTRDGGRGLLVEVDGVVLDALKLEQSFGMQATLADADDPDLVPLSDRLGFIATAIRQGRALGQFSPKAGSFYPNPSISAER